ncbi:MAG: sigma-70 family RNA polymerase sigma factor [Deltaproteobacteria bacterium]|nr:sigma-70 family RNA polymerase sigma factor [Deltaproteobacteria bacterium]
MSGTPHANENDAALIERLLAKDEAAFIELVERHHTGLLRAALTMVRSQASAEEVVQETWRAFLEALSSFERRASLKTFLFRILANQARTRAVRDQRTSPMSELEGDDESPLVDRFGTAGNWLAPPTAWSAETADAILARKQAMEALQQAMTQLPERQRAVVQLRDIDGLSAEEVCELLDVSEVHQRVLLHRARTKLRAVLEQHFRG